MQEAATRSRRRSASPLSKAERPCPTQILLPLAYINRQIMRAILRTNRAVSIIFRRRDQAPACMEQISEYLTEQIQMDFGSSMPLTMKPVTWASSQAGGH